MTYESWFVNRYDLQVATCGLIAAHRKAPRKLCKVYGTRGCRSNRIRIIILRDDSSPRTTSWPLMKLNNLFSDQHRALWPLHNMQRPGRYANDNGPAIVKCLEWRALRTASLFRAQRTWKRKQPDKAEVLIKQNIAYLIWQMSIAFGCQFFGVHEMRLLS